MAISVFRSIENRIALVRSVNTGISCLIDSTGCIREQYLDGILPANPLDRQGVEGWFVDRVPIDRRITFFSVYGCWLNTVMGTTLAALVMYALWEGSKKRHKGASNDKD